MKECDIIKNQITRLREEIRYYLFIKDNRDWEIQSKLWDSTGRLMVLYGMYFDLKSKDQPDANNIIRFPTGRKK